MDNYQVLKVKISNGVEFVNVKTIVKIESLNRHSLITKCDNSTIEAYNSINWFEQHLPVPDFSRCHRSHIVNSQYIKHLNPTTGIVNLNRWGEIPYSRKYKPVLIENIKAYTALH